MEVHVELHGSRTETPTVLVHGAPDRAGAFRPTLELLADRYVALYDRRGYGRSLELGPATSMRDHAEDLLRVIERVGSPAVVVAHSYGSNVTMLASTIDPEAFVVVGLWEPPLPWMDWWPEILRNIHTRMARPGGPEAMIEQMQRQMLVEEAWAALSPEVQQRRMAEGPAFYADISIEFEPPYVFEDVVVPALIGHGTDSRPEFGRAADLLVERLPNARLHRVEGASHYANRTHPKEFAAFVDATWALATEEVVG